MIDISSKTNEHFRRWSDLSSAKGIKKHGEFILMGEKLIEEFLKKPGYKIKSEIIHEELESVTKGRDGQGGKISVFKLPKALFNEIDVVGTHFNLLVLEVPELPIATRDDKIEGLELVCPLGDPSNLGAVARSAVAFGAKKIILTEESCTPFHPKAIKSSAGALLQIPIIRAGSKLADFVSKQDQTFALDMKGENVANFKWPKSLRLVIGEEGPGLSGLRGLQRLSVPTNSVESLNATVAASIAMFCYANS